MCVKIGGVEATIIEYADMLYGVALTLTRDANKAQQLVWNTAAKAMSLRHVMEKEKNAKPWLLTMMRGVFIQSHGSRACAGKY